MTPTYAFKLGVRKSDFKKNFAYGAPWGLKIGLGAWLGGGFGARFSRIGEACYPERAGGAIMNIFNELKRRNVFRAAGLYGIVGWAMAQAASLLENALSLPSWFDAVVISLLLLGFPIAVVFAWAYEMTPEGLKPTKDVSADASIAPMTAKKLDMAILAGLGVLIALIVADRFLGRTDARVIAVGEHGSHAALADNSIAVLPFTDMSSEQDQGYFSDGISEELLNSLAQLKDLRVAGRTSSFAFKGQNKDLRDIGKILGVGYIVEGSIRKAGNKVRVTAQLIQAKDGYQQWSNTYDRSLDDIFAVQDEIAAAIVNEMSAAVPALAAAKEQLKPAPRTADISAYDLFLLAREKMTQTGTRAAYEEAMALLGKALVADPNYAPALAWRAYAEIMLSNAPGAVGVVPVKTALPTVKGFVDRALAADPGSAEGFFALGSYYGLLADTDEPEQLDRAIENLRKAIEIRPTFPQAENDLAYFLDRKGAAKEAMRILADVLARDPGLRDANVIYVNHLVTMGRFEEAEAAIAKWARVSPGQTNTVEASRVGVLAQRGDLAGAWRASEEIARAGFEDNGFANRRFGIRLALGDGDWLLAADLPGRRRAFGAALKGDKAQAFALVDADPSISTTWAGVGNYIQLHYFLGDVAGAVAYYDEKIGSPAAAIAARNGCNCSISPLVLTLKETGHTDYAGVLAAWKAALDDQRELFRNGQLFLRESGDVAAIEGDFAAAREYYAAAIDAGWRSALFIDRRFAAYLPNDEGFNALRTRMRSLINAEREKLGMAPLAPEML